MNRVSTNATTGGTSGPTAAEFCGHCGESSDGGASATSDVHHTCEELLQLEPPRYCAACRRRMKVQVTPLGWSAECSRHGLLSP
ncbi:biotin synthase auxiliary protein BsaP [Pseudarthrobacter sulfonivorans]